jgi:2',3'-cyclic-nucleotide 2'-phosphodiesterase
MRILFIGDIVGTPGVNAVKRAVPALRAAEGIDLVVANAENASAGSGLYPNQYKALRNAGVDALTMGDHIYKKAEIIPTLERDEPICRPANYPPQAPGRDHIICSAKDGTRVAVISLMGRTFMRPVDCPFLAADRILASLPPEVRCVVIDVHAEATADKYLLGHHLKGRVSAVLGTHTHVPTADEQILPGGTAFICDVGMTGPYGGILGRRVDRVLPATITFVPQPFDVASEDPRLAGAIIDIDSDGGRAIAIRRIMLDEAAIARLGGPAPALGDE